MKIPTFVRRLQTCFADKRQEVTCVRQVEEPFATTNL